MVHELVTRMETAAEPEFKMYAATLLHQVGSSLRLFQLLTGLYRENPALISRSSLRMYYPLKNFDHVKRFGRQLDPYLVSALIRQESGFNEKARSPAGAMGLMQLMPGTARLFERLTKRELLDPKTNIRVGARYFSKLLGRYGYDAELALAAYNAGNERVDDWLQRYNTVNRLLFLDLIPYKETREYVATIGRNYFWYLRLYALETLDRRLEAGGRGTDPKACFHHV